MTTMTSPRTDPNRAQADRGFQPAECGAALWSALCEDAAAATMVVSGNGVIQFASRAAAELLGAKPGDYHGRPLGDLIGAPAASERVAVVAEAAATGAVIAIDGMVRGKFIRMVARPLTSRTPGGMVLLVARIAVEHGPGQSARRAETDDFGSLAELTTREMEILKLIGLGLSTPAIAEKLGRSVKTVEWHRVSLGEKLGITNRVELARIAIGAGLVGTDNGHISAKPAAK